MSQELIKVPLHGMSKRKVKFLKAIEPQLVKFIQSVNIKKVLDRFDVRSSPLLVDEKSYRKLQIIMTRYEFQKGKPLSVSALVEVLAEMFVLDYMPKHKIRRTNGEDIRN